MFQYMAKSFISVIDQTLSEIDAWNSEVSQAWEQLFQWITFGLGKGMYKSMIGLVPTTKSELCFKMKSLFKKFINEQFKKQFNVLVVFYLIMCLMKAPKNFGKIAILKT